MRLLRSFDKVRDVEKMLYGNTVIYETVPYNYEISKNYFNQVKFDMTDNYLLIVILDDRIKDKKLLTSFEISFNDINEYLESLKNNLKETTIKNLKKLTNYKLNKNEYGNIRFNYIEI